MAATKSKAGVRRGTSRRGRTAGKSSFNTTAFFIGLDETQPKGTAGFKLKVPDAASKVLTKNPKRMKALLQGYGDAIHKSRTAGRRVSFRVDVDAEGRTLVTPIEETVAAPASIAEEATAAAPELQLALAAARDRGRSRAAEILNGDDMLSADAFAKMLGTTRVTVNTKRQSGRVLGLDGAKRGFRFPIWQLDAEGKPYAELPVLHERLGGPWAVYRFLVQPHGELGGLTGRAALERGKIKAALAAAESVGRDFG
ncbi:XRE family transcriptional regulator [Bradyrhizobium sp. SYSU BS000235]|uniref:XRE family transcriptional regulator n=1 Tax=Bradyrhizobium sp. SYSU BS000235 TaxID=3411332 RepID=UPI003C70E4BB